jgi:small nuclear ribonucleoprotein (snRNP)-like protein
MKSQINLDYERPLDLLNNSKGKEIEIFFKDGKENIIGELFAFDIHINLVILDKSDNQKIFIKGDCVKMVKPNE